MIGLWWFAKRQKENLTRWLDVVAVGVPLGQAIGRWGNWFNQELYGRPTNLPWAIYIKAENNYFHPLFLYESAWNLMVFALVWRLSQSQKRLAVGTIFAVYLAGYGMGRLMLESLRIESWKISGIDVAQAISLMLVVLSLLFIWVSNRKQLNFRRQ